MIQNFVISVKTATKRREHIMCEFGKQGIAFEFFDAVTPTDISKYAQKLSIPIINNQRLTDGEKACFLSHVALWIIWQFLRTMSIWGMTLNNSYKN